MTQGPAGMYLLFLVAGLLFCSCCTTTGVAGPVHEVAPVPSLTPAVMGNESQVLVPPAILNVRAEGNSTARESPAETPSPADPTDNQAIRFTRYADADFALDYPENWTVTNATYTAYFCSPTETVRCYQNEVRTIGPFDFSENSNYKKPARIVVFRSADKKQRIVSFTYDIIDSLRGHVRLDPTPGWCRRRATADYPDVSGTAVVGDFTYSQSGSAMASTHTVTMPRGAAAYPLAYTLKAVITIHHAYEFAFISDTEGIEKYRNLRERIFSSIVPADQG